MARRVRPNIISVIMFSLGNEWTPWRPPSSTPSAPRANRAVPGWSPSWLDHEVSPVEQLGLVHRHAKRLVEPLGLGAVAVGRPLHPTTVISLTDLKQVVHQEPADAPAAVTLDDEQVLQ